jgi:hypothetical protein
VDLVAVHKGVKVDDLRGLDLEVLQGVIGNRDAAPSLELVFFNDAVRIDDLASLAVDKLVRVRLPDFALS